MEDTFIVHATTFLLLTNKTLPRAEGSIFLDIHYSCNSQRHRLPDHLLTPEDLLITVCTEQI